MDDYDMCFKRYLNYVKKYAKMYNVNYNDLFELCYIDFYMCKKNKYSVKQCYNFANKSCKWLAIKLKRENCRFVNFTDIEFIDNVLSCHYQHQQIPYKEIGLTDREILYCKKILAGYSNGEIKEFSPYILKNVRQKLSKFYGIENYHNYVHHKEKRSEKKIQNLKRIRSLGRSDKCGRPKKKVAIYKDGVIIKTFDSGADCSRFLTDGKSSMVAAVSISRGTKCKGFEIKYI